MKARLALPLLVLLSAATAGGLACRASAEPPALQESAGTLSRATLRIEGMTCASCTTAVRIALRKLEGVQEATVSFPDKRAVVSYDASRVTPAQLAEAVSRLGYQAAPEAP